MLDQNDLPKLALAAAIAGLTVAAAKKYHKNKILKKHGLVHHHNPYINSDTAIDVTGSMLDLLSRSHFRGRHK